MRSQLFRLLSLMPHGIQEKRSFYCEKYIRNELIAEHY